jgi:hypothetical protein
MSLYKPWEKDYNRLLQKIVAQWGGTVDDAELKSRQNKESYETRTLGASFIYPIYTGTMKNIQFMIEISLFPGSVRTQSRIVAIDAIRYLRIYFFLKNNYNLQLTREDLEDRMEKFFHLTNEIQTGNPDFDKRFFIKSSTQKDQALVTESKIQELVTRLDPFELLEIIPTGIIWSITLTQNDQLDFSRVDKTVLTLLELTETINEHKNF